MITNEAQTPSPTPRTFFSLTQAIYNATSLGVVLIAPHLDDVYRWVGDDLDATDYIQWVGEKSLGDYLDVTDSLSRYMMTPAGSNWAVYDGVDGVLIGFITNENGTLLLIVTITPENDAHPDIIHLIDTITNEVPSALAVHA